MKSIVITGSTRGIGFHLADNFLRQGCNVVISGRSQTSVDTAIAKLLKSHSEKQIFGCACDVSDFKQVESLWQSAMTQMGSVDIWINNAGIGQHQKEIWNFPIEKVKQIFEVDYFGTVYGIQIAYRGMLEQGHGFIYNMEGYGSGGEYKQKLAIYGSAKAALTSLSNALAHEAKDSVVKVGRLSPGMVTTEFLSDQYIDRPHDFERAKKIFNILADRAETVTPWLAEKILNNTKNGVAFKWLTRPKIIWRFLTAGIIKRDLFKEE